MTPSIDTARVLQGSPPATGTSLEDLQWRDDLGARHPMVSALVQAHREDLASHTPACSAHALAPEDFGGESVTLLTAWQGDALVACGAVLFHGKALGELKTMRTVNAWRGRGVGDAMFNRLLAIARAAGSTLLALETGSGAPFEPALRFYDRHGFVACAPFADYREDPFSVYLSRAI